LMLKPYLQNASDQKEQNKAYYRMAGAYVLYRDNSRYAKFQINEARAWVTYKQNRFDMVLTGYSSDQKKTKKPMLLLASAQNQAIKNLEFKLLNNRYSTPYNTAVNLKIKDLALDGLQSDILHLQKANSDILATADLDLENDTVTADGDIYFDDMQLSAKDSKELTAALSVVDDLDLSIQAKLSQNDTDVDISSQSAAKISRLVAQKYIEDKTGLSRQNLQNELQEKMKIGMLEDDYAQVSKYLSVMQNTKQSTDKLLQTLIKELKQKQQERVNSKAKDMLKGLF